MSHIGYNLLRVFLWCLFTSFKLLGALFITLIAALVYEWLFPDPFGRWAASYGMADAVRYFGWIKGGITFGLAFVIIAYLLYAKSRNFDKVLRKELAENEADLQSHFGRGAVIEPHGIGYKVTLNLDGKQFEANCYTYGSSGSFDKVANYSATSAVTFGVSNSSFEITLQQKWGWSSPRSEPPEVVMSDGNLFKTLEARFDCYYSDRRLIDALLYDSAVRREILPEKVVSTERSVITVKEGRVLVECSANLPPSETLARKGTFDLMKRMLVRARAIESAIEKFLANEQQKNA